MQSGKIFITRMIFCVVLLVVVNSQLKAQNNPSEVVASFGHALSSWCNTNQVSYRERIDQLCSGPKKCRVEDVIHAEYQKGRGLTNYETFVLDSYLNMFQSLIPRSLNYKMSNVKVVGSDEMPNGTLTFITADITLSGAINKSVTDLFLVRNNKISGIYSYSSYLGFSHLNGSLIKTLQNGKYKWCSSLQNGHAIVVNEDKKEGMIDIRGKIIIPCIWDHIIYFGGDFALGGNYKLNKQHITYDLRNNGRQTSLYTVQDWYVGRNDSTVTFSEDYAVVYNFEIEKSGYLHINDKTYHVEYIFDDATRFNEGYAFVKYAGVGMIIDNNFTPIVLDTKEYAICDKVHNGLAKVRDKKTGKYGFINTKGELVVQCIYDDVGYFSEGICCVRIGDYINGSFGCINTRGEVVIPIIYDGNWGIFEDGYIEIGRKDGQHTLLGLDNKPLPGFSWEYDDIRYLCDGLARFDKNGKSGFVNSKGKIVIPPKYDFVTFFRNGIACIGKIINGQHKYGGINKNGIEVIPCIYDDIFYFQDGIALVKKDNQVGLIDIYGNSTFFSKQQK